MKTLFAYTENFGNFPAFINVSEAEPTERGKPQFRITLRARRSSVPAEIVISAAALAELAAAIAPTGTPAPVEKAK